MSAALHLTNLHQIAVIVSNLTQNLQSGTLHTYTQAQPQVQVFHFQLDGLKSETFPFQNV